MRTTNPLAKVANTANLKPKLAKLATLATKATQQDLYVSMKAAIIAIEGAFHDGLATPAEEQRLGAMPTNTILEINAWRDAWLSILSRKESA